MKKSLGKWNVSDKKIFMAVDKVLDAVPDRWDLRDVIKAISIRRDLNVKEKICLGITMKEEIDRLEAEEEEEKVKQEELEDNEHEEVSQEAANIAGLDNEKFQEFFNKNMGNAG